MPAGVRPSVENPSRGQQKLERPPGWRLVLGISCLLVVCCMKRSEFEAMIEPLKRSVKPGGMVIMSSRNYLDPELQECRATQKAVEPNTFAKKDAGCEFTYFIEQNRLREVFQGFDILYYYEGFAPCKYNHHPKHGDSQIICRRGV